MCLSTVVTRTGEKWTVAWTPPTPPSYEAECGIAAECGCAAHVSISFLDQIDRASDWRMMMTTTSTRACATHALSTLIEASNGQLSS